LFSREKPVRNWQRFYEIFAKLKADLRKQGAMLMDFDLMIAAISLRNDLILVTNNHMHFSRIPGIKLENWSHDGA
jgi:tRNA(fMet)-specific endonuclease VapC